MNIESIIGIVAGLLTIAAAIGIKFDLIQLLKKKPTTELFDCLTQKEGSDDDRRALLRKLNKSSLIRNKIKEEYIQNFRLDKRGREAVLFDICDYNNIEPTDDICKGLIGVSMPSLYKRYHNNRQKENVESSFVAVQDVEFNVPSIPAKQMGEQTVYMSELLKTRYPKTCDELTRILEKHNVKYSFLKGTKDIWCRDYMPVQTESGKFIQFIYDPSYLKGNKEWEESRTDVKEVCKLNGIDTQYSDINIDGGNVLICDGRAIISDRIFPENPNWDRDELIKELGRLLECEIVIIPTEKADVIGHADGMVRFVNRNTILGNNLAAEYKYWREGMQKVIEQYGLKYIDVPFFVAKDSKYPLSAIGIYVNYLEVNNLIVLPIFGRDEDQQVIDIIKSAFPDRVVETINYNDVALEGGLLNCTTWVARRK